MEHSLQLIGATLGGAPADISCVAWNRKVQHILASTSHGGLSVVWDLKLKRSVTAEKWAKEIEAMY